MKRRKKRSYVLRARRERLEGTRARIVEAIMRLHEEVGPRRTTVSAIARRAGVERLTVYRHFQDEASMFAACSQHFLTLNPPPDPASWGGEQLPERRAHRGLEAIYGYFRRTAGMFEKIYRDADDYEALQVQLAGFEGYLRDVADGLANAWPEGDERARAILILRHATRFSTWQSLEAERVPDARKVALMLDWLAAPEQAASHVAELTRDNR